jgi:hypothetical protein
MFQRSTETTWNSTHDMINDGLRCKHTVIQLVKDYPNNLKEWSLGRADWSFLCQLYDVLHPFNDFTKLASEGQATIHTIRSVYIELADLIHKVSHQEDEYNAYDMRIINAFKSEVVKDKFEKYNEYIDGSPIYFIASVLDPRIKGSLIQSEYSDGNTRVASIRSTLHSLYIS